MGFRFGQVVPVPGTRQRARRRFAPSRASRQSRRPGLPDRRVPFAMPILVVVAGLAIGIATSDRAPAFLTDLIDRVASFVGIDNVSTASIETATTTAPADGLAGRARIVDADTIDIGGTRIRLYAIDAPEGAQRCYVDGSAVRCGARAADALETWIAGRIVACIEVDIDRYGRTVATCRVDGEDVGRWLVRNGHAVAYRRYGADYICDEAAAAAQQRGIWAGTFVAPWEWRNGSDDAAGSYNPGWPASCG